MKTVSTAILVFFLAVTVAHAQDPAFWDWAPTPPMGWNSWDCYGPTVVEAEVKANADFMAEHLAEYGWEYVVVDIRWYVENTKSQGYNQTDPRYVIDPYGRYWPAVNRFPSAADGKGFAPLAAYVHDKGLKFGVHLMRGIPVIAVEGGLSILGSDSRANDIYTTENQCSWLRDNYTIVAGRDGAQEYYNSVFQLLASWGVDYVKVDDLAGRLPELEMIRRAIDACGRPMVLSVSPGGTTPEMGEHAQMNANLWRISDDFWDRWRDIMAQFPRCAAWTGYTGPGHWPDADMLPLGHIGIRAERGVDRSSLLTQTEQITLMTLWSMFRSPLMFGGDLPSSDDFTISLLTNREVLEVNQSSTNNRQLSSSSGIIVWTADDPDSGDKYLAMFNTSNAGDDPDGTRQISVALADIGLSGTCAVRDLWAGQNIGTVQGACTADVPFHGAVLYRLSPRR